MRLFSFILGLFLCTSNAWAYMCPGNSWPGSNDHNDMKFIFTTKAAYDLAKNTPEDSAKNISPGNVYGCSSSTDSCTSGHQLLIGSGHWWNGSSHGPVLYTCSSDDGWTPKRLSFCVQWMKNGATKLDDTWTSLSVNDVNGLYKGGKFYRGGPNLVCVMPKKVQDCYDSGGLWTYSDENKPINTGKCIADGNGTNCKEGPATCLDGQNAKTCYKKCHSSGGGATVMIVECKSGFKENEKNAGWTTADGKALYKSCVKESGGGDGGSGGSVGGGGNRSGGGNINNDNSGTDQQNCENSGGTWASKNCSCNNDSHLKQSANQKTCECVSGYARDGRNQCVATDETACKNLGSTVAKWTNNQCVCVDTTKIYSAETQNCVPNPKVTECNQVTGAQWTNGECKCTTPGYELKDGRECVKGAALISTEQGASRTKISSLYKKLNGMSNDFQVSVWKNAEGNFNTARLASDSIAAVVLGTTGALVTSNIVKKNQVSSGFEDINCQIGGQTVAGWGDEFSVGMQ